MQCVILVGGLGTRLGALTNARPKPMLDVAGRPFIERLIDNAARFGATRVLLLAGYLSSIVHEHFPCGVYAANGRTVSVEVLAEPEPLGTGGALRFAADRLEQQFLMLNGDSMFSFNWLDLIAGPLPEKAVGRLARRRVDDASRYGLLAVDSGERITEMRRGQEGCGAGEINGGVYLLRRDILEYIGPKGAVSLENDVFPRAIVDGRLYSRLYDGFFIDIGVPHDLAKAQDPRLYRRGAVFFDRDGVLNEDHGYVYEGDRFDWLPGAREAIRLVNDLDMYAFVVTNQAGVARGFYTEEHIRLLFGHMQDELHALGAHIDDYRYCPHHPEAKLEEYRRTCNWRKPGPGMIRDLCAHWPVDLARSFLIGDMDSDIRAADAAGLRAVKFDSGASRIDLAAVVANAANVRAPPSPR